MVDLREMKEGSTLDGVYTFEHWIRDEGAGAFFAVLNGSGDRLLVKLLPDQGPESERQFLTWQRSRHLRHAHLLDLREVGRTELEGEGYIYGVFEYPDDVLASAPEQGPLSEPETRGVLEAAVAALRYLHGQGLVHGAVDPSHIFAVGETVKLSSDALRESDDLEGHPEDVRQLGELVCVLRAPEPLSGPLATIARHATDEDARQRWNLAEIAGAIEEPAAPAAVAPAVTLTETAPRPVTVPAPNVKQPSAFPKWIYAGVALLLLCVVMYNLRRKPETAVVRPVTPVAVAPVPPAPVSAPAPAPATGLWHVIAFTYRSRDIADKKVKQINNRWPDLRAAVFAPKGLGGYYLVALGDGMKREEATRLQRKARSLGLPQDTYVQNYSE